MAYHVLLKTITNCEYCFWFYLRVRVIYWNNYPSRPAFKSSCKAPDESWSVKIEGSIKLFKQIIQFDRESSLLFKHWIHYSDENDA